MESADGFEFYTFSYTIDFCDIGSFFSPSPSTPTEEQRVTAEDLLAWARSKPATGVYNYRDSQGCAIACFLKESGRFEAPLVTSYSYGDRASQFSLPAELDKAVYAKGHRNGWTFGALVRRLEALLGNAAPGRVRNLAIAKFIREALACSLLPKPQLTNGPAPTRWQAIDAYLTDIEDVARERVQS